MKKLLLLIALVINGLVYAQGLDRGKTMSFASNGSWRIPHVNEPDLRIYTVTSIGSFYDTLPQPYPDTVHITLTHSQLLFVLAFLPDKSEPENNRFIIFCMQNIPIRKDTTYPGGVMQIDPVAATPNAQLTYAASVNFLAYVYTKLGEQPESLVAVPNATLQPAIFAQIQDRPDVKARLGIIAADNARRLAEKIHAAADYLVQINPASL